MAAGGKIGLYEWLSVRWGLERLGFAGCRGTMPGSQPNNMSTYLRSGGLALAPGVLGSSVDAMVS